MSHDPRDEIWNAAFRTYYEAFYNEILADKLNACWLRIDVLTKILVAVTASGSVAAGWSIWIKSGGAAFWAVLAGSAALLSIAHSAVGVADRLNNSAEVRRSFRRLRIDIETFRDLMRIDPEFPTDDFKEDYQEYRGRFAECLDEIKDDILRGKLLKKKAQRDVDQILCGQIEPKGYTHGHSNGHERLSAETDS